MSIIKGRLDTIKEVYSNFSIIGKSIFTRKSGKWFIGNKKARVETFSEAFRGQS